MSEIGLHIRCQRCGTEMELRDPVSADAWKPDQFWVCPKCGRHFWSTYPPPAREKAKDMAGAPPANAAQATKPTATAAAPTTPPAQTPAPPSTK
jgi:DNA-directed RNA polymerase subunit RPC12/RpoP